MRKTISRPMHLAEYCYAYSWWRLLEWIIDILVFYVITFVSSLLYYMANPSQLDAANGSESGLTSLISLAIWMFYYFICEAFCNGRTIGKLITGLKVVDIDGNKPKIGRIAIRTLARLIPFDYLSFFGTDKWSSEEHLDGFWHDSISKTYVIRIKKIAEYRELEAKGENVVKKDIYIPDNSGGTIEDGVFKPGETVIYPVVNRVMFVEKILDNGKVRCYQINSKGEQEPCGDYSPNQIEHFGE